MLFAAMVLCLFDAWLVFGWCMLGVRLVLGVWFVFVWCLFAACLVRGWGLCVVVACFVFGVRVACLSLVWRLCGNCLVFGPCLFGGCFMFVLVLFCCRVRCLFCICLLFGWCLFGVCVVLALYLRFVWPLLV